MPIDSIISAIGVVTIVAGVLLSLAKYNIALEVPLFLLSSALTWNRYYTVEVFTPVTSFWVALLGHALMPISVAVMSRDINVSIGLATAVFWGVEAVTLSSYILGTFSVVALLVSVGFTGIAMPMATVIGFRSRDHLMNSMNVTFYMLLLYIYLVGQNLMHHPHVEPFSYGIKICGTFVFYLSVLINSSMFISGFDRRYFVANTFAVAVFIAGVFASSFTVELRALSNIASVFAMLYICEKYWEIRWEHLPVALILFGGTLYGLSFWIRALPTACYL